MSSTAEILAKFREDHPPAAKPLAQLAASREGLMGLELLPGARVYDTVTGEEGIVLSGTVQHIVVPTADAGENPPAEGEAQ